MNKTLSTFILILIAFGSYAQKKSYRLPPGISADQYSSQTIVVKFKIPPESKLSGRTFGKTSIKKSSRAIPSTVNAISHPLANIYKVSIADGLDIESAINDLLQDDNVIYAEPYFNHRPLFIPNDPAANPSGGAQDYLSIIRAYDAWTIERGDSTIIIGVLDSGVQPNHPDLIDQIAYNLDDPVNGIDDDNDGLIDNYIGWDIADDDNNPAADTDAHGTEVTSTSSARVNNGEGMAGTGYHSKFMPIKTFRSGSDAFNMGYEAIALAADLGCKVINLSWGAPNSFSQFGQDVVNYATLERDVVIVAAAGNTNEQLDFYPASFDNVLSVGASNMLDEKAFFATFSYNIDMMAPGDQIYSATNNSTYIGGRIGTSYSSPMVAGAAALVRARFPNLNAQQVIERLRATADDIYEIGGNNVFEGQLGRGRLNMFRALTDETPSVRIDSMFYSNGLGEYAYFSDTLEVSVRLKNYLSRLDNATATLSSNSGFVTIISSQLAIPTIGTLETLDNFELPFKVVLAENTPPNEELIFRLDMDGLVYDDFEYFSITTSDSFTTIQGNNLAMTVSGDGDLGYDEIGFSNGVGVTFENQAVASNIGLILAFDKNTVPDNGPTDLIDGLRDEDFELTTPLKRYSNSSSPVDIRSVFSVEDSIRIEQTYLSNQVDDFIIQQYRIVNTGTVSLTDFSLAIYADWNIGNKDFNEAQWLAEEKLGYIHDGNTYIGLALISDQDAVYSAINNKNFNGNTADIPIVLNDSVKFSHASQGILKTQAGENNGGNDVSHLLGAHIPLTSSLSAEKVALVTVAGHSLTELIANLNAAKAHLQAYKNAPPVISISETCVGEPAIIDPASGTNFDFYSDAALTNFLFSGDSYETPPLSNAQSFYVINKDNPYPSDVFRVIAKPKLVNASFQANPDPLLLDESGSTSTTFADTSTDGVNWLWDFDNGFTSIVKNPTMNFTEIGTYEISLTVVNDIGCEEGIVQTLTVANRSNQPNISNQFLCKGEEVTLSATNATNLEFYADEDLTNLIASTASLTTSFDKDTTLYVISTDSLFQSNPRAVIIDIDEVNASFNYQPDTLDISSKTLMHLTSTSVNSALTIWYNDGSLISTEPNFNFNYQGLSTLDLLLVAESTNSCTDSVRLELPLEVSPAPEEQIYAICENETVTIMPGGSFNHFYADANQTQLIAKGSSLTLSNLENDTTIYVSNNASFLESEPVAFSIDISDIQAEFEFSSNPLNLAESNSVEFIDQSIDASSWLWFLGADTLSTFQNPLVAFEELGSYTIQLFIEDINGCMDSTSQSLEVVTITSLEDDPKFLVYPNPVRDQLYINTGEEVNVRMLDQTGKLLVRVTGINPLISFQDLPQGIYFLEINLNGKVVRYKILK